MRWYLKVLLDYCELDGRARRTEFWMFTLVHWLVSLALWTLDGVMSLVGWPVIGLGLLYTFGTFLPELAVRVRRLHDTNRTGWWILLLWIPQLLTATTVLGMLPDSDGSSGWARRFEWSLVPLFGGALAFLALMCREGTHGENRFGRDPRGFQAADRGAKLRES